ncbi:hypothetical protein BCR44DRAFT_29398 [Catenaria anguillulae PL171]|uniref:Mitochondrial carrier domain-containing protein n=1 Tax=Catenaria anguillulae PL171 TaxID=765915 RepID=A0A1Y2HE73_9FUNG|nr:hypothetical protein BCR44DRAFT_29398 [Catenaria anguillulae PL171]
MDHIHAHPLGAQMHHSGDAAHIGPGFAFDPHGPVDDQFDADFSAGGFARYAFFRFFGHATWSPFTVSLTVLQAQYLANLATRRRLAALGSGTDTDGDETDGVIAGGPSDSDGDSEPDASSDSMSHSIDDLDYLLGHPKPRSSGAPSGPLPRVDSDGYVLPTPLDDDSSIAPLHRLPLCYHGVWPTIRAIRRHPEEGALSLYKGLFANYSLAMATEMMEPTLTSSACEFLGIDDALMPVDHDNPLPIALVCLTSSVLVDYALSPISVAAHRLMVQTARPDRKYRGFLHAVRSQFLDARSNPYMSWSLVSPTLAVSIVHHLFSLATPLFIDRLLGISEIYNPVKYAIIEFGVKMTRDLLLLPLQTARCRLYTQSFCQPRDGRAWVALVHQSDIPYVSINHCLLRMVHEEGGAKKEYLMMEKSKKRPIPPQDVGLLDRFAPLYTGLTMRVTSNVLYLLVQVLTEVLELGGDEEF